MFFELFVNQNLSYKEDDYKILDTDIIEKYNINNLEIRFKNMIKDIKNSQYKYLNIPYANIEYSYEPKYEQHINHFRDSTGKKAIERIETEEELKEAYSILKNIFDNNLAYYEKIIFIDLYLLKRGRKTITEKLHIGTKIFLKIRESIIIKFALGLQWEKQNVDNYIIVWEVLRMDIYCVEVIFKGLKGRYKTNSNDSEELLEIYSSFFMYQKVNQKLDLLIKKNQKIIIDYIQVRLIN